MQLLPVLFSPQVCVVHHNLHQGQHIPSSCCTCHMCGQAALLCQNFVVLSSQKQPWCMHLSASLQAAQALLCQASCLPYTRRVYALAHMAPGVESMLQAAATHMHISVHMLTHHPLLQPSARTRVYAAVGIPLHVLLMMQGLLLCLLQAWGQTRGLFAGIEVCLLRISGAQNQICILAGMNTGPQLQAPVLLRHFV